MASSLKNKTRILSLLFIVLVALIRCTGTEQKNADTSDQKDSASCAKPLNPNGDSELSVLMREMLHSSESLKEMIKKGEVPRTFPQEFLKIHTAAPTDAETKKASFEGYASAYVMSLQELYKSPKDDLGKNYNAVISSCVSCHQEHCPGPLKAINKLKI
jgi:cytochrome c556